MLNVYENGRIVRIEDGRIMQQESFADGGRIYMDMIHVSMPVDSWEVPDHVPQNEEGVPGWWWMGIPKIVYALRGERSIVEEIRE